MERLLREGAGCWACGPNALEEPSRQPGANTLQAFHFRPHLCISFRMPPSAPSSPNKTASSPGNRRMRALEFAVVAAVAVLVAAKASLQELGPCLARVRASEEAPEAGAYLSMLRAAGAPVRRSSGLYPQPAPRWCGGPWEGRPA